MKPQTAKAVTTYIVTKKDFRTDKVKELESFKTMREAKAHILKLVYGQVGKYVPIELFDVKIKVADVAVKPQELTKEQLCIEILSDGKGKAVSDKDLKRACRKPKDYILKVYRQFVNQPQEYPFYRALLLA